MTGYIRRARPVYFLRPCKNKRRGRQDRLSAYAKDPSAESTPPNLLRQSRSLFLLPQVACLWPGRFLSRCHPVLPLVATALPWTFTFTFTFTFLVHCSRCPELHVVNIDIETQTASVGHTWPVSVGSYPTRAQAMACSHSTRLRTSGPWHPTPLPG